MRTAPAPNRKWLTDITAVWTAEGWLYLAVVLEVYSRLVVGWAMASHRDESLVEEARLHGTGLVQTCGRVDASWRLEAKSHTSLAYQAVLAQFPIQVSMSGKGDCYENAMMESFCELAQNRVCQPTSLSEPFGGQKLHL